MLPNLDCAQLVIYILTLVAGLVLTSEVNKNH
jgi:hypothetical protein